MDVSASRVGSRRSVICAARGGRAGGASTASVRRCSASGHEHHAGLRRLAAEAGRLVRSRVRLHQSRVGRARSHVPLGADNTIEPGGPDQGQPTNFFPRRNRFVFQVRVPKDFGTREIVWTLTSKGTHREDVRHAQARLRARRHRRSCPTSAPAAAEHDAGHGRQQGARAVARRPRRSCTAKVGEPLALAAMATDDGKPNRPEHAGGARRHLHAAAERQRPAPLVHRVPRRRRSGHLRSAAEEDVGGHARRRRIAVVGRAG